MILGVVGGVLGALLIRLNVAAAVHRRNSVVGQWPLLEVVVVTSVTAIISTIVRRAGPEPRSICVFLLIVFTLRFPF
jgi:H+/Cl- antiporter ClcA